MSVLSLPADHPLRAELSEEVHARPPHPLSPPMQASYIVLQTPPDRREANWAAVADLAASFGVGAPDVSANYFTADLGEVRVIWECHSEFTRYTFIRPDPDLAEALDDPPVGRMPRKWLVSLPGEVLFAAHVLMIQDEKTASQTDELTAKMFGDGELVGASIAAGGAVAMTDFRTYKDGFNRFLIRNRSMTERQAGRHVRALLEMDTYRMMALLGLPVARELGRLLTGREKELAGITREMVETGASDENALLDRLTRLASDIERRHSEHYYRFSASAAYYGIVQARIGELREERIEGLQTFAEFTERRLAPAMNTVQAVSQRLESMSKHLSRATQLLSTRVALTQEQQSRKLLEAMARRAKLQLRLQQTVEGLSVAAITYYVVGLINYAAKGSETLGSPMDSALLTAISIPVVALALTFGVRRIRRMLKRSEK